MIQESGYFFSSCILYSLFCYQALSSGDNDLALATAINRFLNHISHLGR
jgi:hypothetical protein